jgi:hypothetical protein
MRHSPFFLHQFRLSTARNSISSAVTEGEWVGKMKSVERNHHYQPKWNALGHHKALLKEFPVMEETPPGGQPTIEFKRQISLQGQLDLLRGRINENSERPWRPGRPWTHFPMDAHSQYTLTEKATMDDHRFSRHIFSKKTSSP